MIAHKNWLVKVYQLIKMGFYLSHKNEVGYLFRYDRLDELITATGKKKNYLSVKIGHSGRYLNDARKQNTDIKLAEVQILADELGTTAEYLRGESDQKEKPTGSADGQIPHAGRREILASEGVRILLDADAKVTDEQLEDIIDFIQFQQRKNGR